MILIRCQFAYIKWLQINTSDKKDITSILKTSVISNMQHQYSFDEMINRSFFSSRKLKCLLVKARKLYNIYGSFNKPALSKSFPSVLTRLTHEDCLLSWQPQSSMRQVCIYCAVSPDVWLKLKYLISPKPSLFKKWHSLKSLKQFF